MRLRGTAGRARAVAAAVLAACVVALPGVPALGAPAAATAPAPARVAATTAPAAPSTDDLPVSVAVTAVSPQVLQPGQDLTVTATLRNDGEEVVEQPRASVRIYRYRMSTREQVASWAEAGDSSPIGDVAATVALDAPLAPGATATVTVTVPAADVGLLRTEDAWGPRGVTLDVGDGRTRVGVDRTYLLWDSAEEVPTAHVGVLSSVVGPATDPATSGAAAGDDEEAADGGPAPTGTPAPTPTGSPAATGQQEEQDDVAAEEQDGAAAAEEDERLTALTASGGRLTKLLQATADHPFVSWAVDPALVDQAATGSRAAQTWLTGLTEAADGREVLRLPWADPDLAAIAHAGSADSAADLLALARGVASQHGGALWQDAAPVLWAADDVPDQVTADRAAHSDPGTPWVVGPDALPADDSEVPSSPTSVSTPSGALATLAPDATLSGLLADPAASQPGVTPATAAQRVLAESAVIARSDDAATTYVLATTPRDWQPTTAVAQAQLDALAGADWVETATVADMLAAEAAGEADGDGAAREALPASQRGDAELTPAWVNALAAQWRSAEEFAAVVDDPAALLAGLDADLVAPLAVAWRDDVDGRAAAINVAIAESQARQSGLSVVLNEQLTVISSSAQISVAVRNDLDQAARVRVELRPQKGCLDTTRSPVTEVAPDADTTVQLTLRASANCDVTVEVSLVSETGRQLATPQEFSARVAPTIESVGGIVVGVLLALVLAFGIWRTVRRGQTARRGARVVPDPAPGDPDPPASGEPAGGDPDGGTPPADGPPASAAPAGGPGTSPGRQDPR
ncbi:DUF6049 family protein [Cellulomonas pakistanensis]|uniref:CARDB domain-containing protein n=1 Tax=Cellulomonas pakistanensis TaxID=992287 RepID=A0A919U456_9CELL|nr:DUF6049 family protein [Cellulomonas pakistanensis]GIG34779.1 hypothetical protein Cpa01nite_01600 [Cellulomonas pakistanensis]